jgi:predicted amidohydrolase
VAAGQWGEHNEKIQTYGHSLVVDPWGDVLLDLGEGEKIGVVDLDLLRIDLIRHSVLMNRN